jgi:hypothetical protein
MAERKKLCLIWKQSKLSASECCNSNPGTLRVEMTLEQACTPMSIPADAMCVQKGWEKEGKLVTSFCNPMCALPSNMLVVSQCLFGTNIRAGERNGIAQDS